ncbi:MAG: cytochrome P450 [Caldilinea sp. CFX5]|nr:cytochrome P450 [Caldilinea sp. CFX5]
MTFFDPTAPAFRQNPYPVYAELRAQAPIVFWEERGVWLLSRWADCTALLRDLRLGNDPPGHDMLFQNPPDHTRLRGLVQKAFTPRRIELLRDQIQRITDGLLDQAQGRQAFDLIAALAYPLPVAVIAALMGIPAEDHTKFHAWSNALVDSLDLVPDPDLAERLAPAEAGFRAYFDDLIRERRRNPGDDLLSALIAAEEAGDRLSSDELYFSARLLLVAGYETTVGLIGNGALALLRNPAQRELLQEQPGLIGNAVEELLRYDSPIQMIGRTVLETMEWQDVVFTKGQGVALLTGAANHDPALVARPDQLDIMRPPAQHLAFGSGIHYCLGAPLARLEGQIAIQTLLRRFPDLQLSEEAPPHRNNFVFRSLQRLLVINP